MSTVRDRLLAYQGYRSAEQVDARIDDLLRRFPPGPETALFWRAFLRTVGSSLEIVGRVLPAVGEEVGR